MPSSKPLDLALSGLAILAALTAATPGGATEASPLSQACASAGSWLEPASGQRHSTAEMMTGLAERGIVLLGERHTSAEHHRWQLHALAGLQARHAKLVVGFEMFPRAVQTALDAWSAGQLTEAEFLEESRWNEVWGFDAGLYLPLFHFARQHRVPMVALNVDRALVRRVGREGWDQVPPEAREGLSDPAPASEAYRAYLAEVYGAEQSHRERSTSESEDEDQPVEAESDEAPDLSTILASDDFRRFTEAQLTWDRAMAEALAAARRAEPEALVIGVLGSGHIRQRHGVPHQLADLGEDDVAVLLPVEIGEPCEALQAETADAVFLLASEESQDSEPAKPRLGVVIEASSEGLRILQVAEGSVAEATGLLAGDVITSAAAVAVRRTPELVEIVQRQAPGTWLPLQVKRAGEDQSLVAKFPTSFE